MKTDLTEHEIANSQLLADILNADGTDSIIEKLNKLSYRYSFLVINELGKDLGKELSKEASDHIYLLAQLIEAFKENSQLLADILNADGTDSVIENLNKLSYRYSFLVINELGKDLTKELSREASDHIYLLAQLNEAFKELEFVEKV